MFPESEEKNETLPENSVSETSVYKALQEKCLCDLIKHKTKVYHLFVQSSFDRI